MVTISVLVKTPEGSAIEISPVHVAAIVFVTAAPQSQSSQPPQQEFAAAGSANTNATVANIMPAIAVIAVSGASIFYTINRRIRPLPAPPRLASEEREPRQTPESYVRSCVLNVCSDATTDLISFDSFDSHASCQSSHD
jgi:hypothetical protein